MPTLIKRLSIVLGVFLIYFVYSHVRNQARFTSVGFAGENDISVETRENSVAESHKELPWIDPLDLEKSGELELESEAGGDSDEEHYFTPYKSKEKDAPSSSINISVGSEESNKPKAEQQHVNITSNEAKANGTIVQIVDPKKKLEEKTSTNITDQSQKAVPERCAPVRGYFNCCYPVTALASFPGSGNTWMRYLLEEATGYYTGSVYWDGDLMKRGFRGEGKRTFKVVAVKTHRYGETNKVDFERILLLNRSPFESFVSEFNRQRAGHTGVARESAYKQGWPSFFTKNVIFWKDFHQYWFSLDVPVYIIQYESLKTDLRAELKRIFSFLDLTVSEERLDCVINNSEGLFHRKHREDPYDPFTDDMRTEMNQLVAEMEKQRDDKLAKQKGLSVSGISTE